MKNALLSGEACYKFNYWLAPVGASYSVAYALAAEYRAANDLD